MDRERWQFRTNTYFAFDQLAQDLTLESADGWQLVHIDEQRYLTGQSTGPAWHSTFRCLLKKQQEEARQ